MCDYIERLESHYPNTYERFLVCVERLINQEIAIQDYQEQLDQADKEITFLKQDLTCLKQEIKNKDEQIQQLDDAIVFYHRNS